MKKNSDFFDSIENPRYALVARVDGNIIHVSFFPYEPSETECLKHTVPIRENYPDKDVEWEAVVGEKLEELIAIMRRAS